MDSPTPHRRIAVDGALAWVVPGLEQPLAAILSSTTLHRYAAVHPARRALGGRGRAWRIPAPAAPDGTDRWAVRHYTRGGAVAGPLLRDRYARAGVPRPLAELRVSEAARARGVPTPRVLAAVSYPAGPLFRRGDIATAWIAGSRDLARELFGPQVPSEAREEDRLAALKAAGRLVRELVRAGVEHADLNAANVALQSGAEGIAAWALDLDRARLHPAPVVGAGVRMLARLERSLAKLESATGVPLPADARATLRAAVGDLQELVTAGPGWASAR